MDSQPAAKRLDCARRGSRSKPMKAAYKGLAVALIHILIVLSLGGKLLHDRATRPRIWVRTASVDPDLPIRGRYLTLNLEVHAPELVQAQDPKHPGLYSGAYVDLAVENGQLVAHRSELVIEMMVNSWNRLQNRGNGNF